jgi:hypothetical protein
MIRRYLTAINRGGEGNHDSAILIYDTNWNLKYVVTEGEPYNFAWSDLYFCAVDSGYIKLIGQGAKAYAYCDTIWCGMTNLNNVKQTEIGTYLYELECTSAEGWCTFDINFRMDLGCGGRIAATESEAKSYFGGGLAGPIMPM